MAGQHPPPGRDARPSKKTDAVEVRISPEDKAAFMTACRARGESASDVLRTAMRRYSGGPPQTRRVLMAMTVLASAAAAFWMGASLTPDAAEPQIAAGPAGESRASAEAAASAGIATQLALSLVSEGSERTVRTVRTSVTANGNEAARIQIDNIPAEELEPVFGPIEPATVSLVITLTGQPTPPDAPDAPGAVLYTMQFDVQDQGRSLPVQAFAPAILARFGEEASMAIGAAPGEPGSQIAISLTPAPAS